MERPRMRHCVTLRACDGPRPVSFSQECFCYQISLSKIAFRHNLCASELVPLASFSQFMMSRQTKTLFTKQSKAIFGERLIWMIHRPQCQHFPNLCLQRRSSIHTEEFWIILSNWNIVAGLKRCVSSKFSSSPACRYCCSSRDLLGII